MHIVAGDFDDGGYPEHKVVTIGAFKIGLMHGHQVVPWGDSHSLAMHQRRLDVDILITGHTHKNEVNEFNGKWFINPGASFPSKTSMRRNDGLRFDHGRVLEPAERGDAFVHPAGDPGQQGCDVRLRVARRRARRGLQIRVPKVLNRASTRPAATACLH
jgi:hypothetical protein